MKVCRSVYWSRVSDASNTSSTDRVNMTPNDNYHWQAHILGIRVTGAANVNSLKSRQIRRYFAVNFLNEHVWIPIKISPKFVPKGPINNIPALVQIMAWRRTGDKALSEPMMTQFNDAYMSLGLNELIVPFGQVHRPNYM